MTVPAWIGLVQFALGIVLLLIAADTARRLDGVGVWSFSATTLGLGVWTAASGVYQLIIAFYQMRSPDGIIRFALLQSASPAVELGFYISMITESALQTVVPLAYTLFVLVYTTRTDRSERQMLFWLVPFGLLYTAGTTYTTLVSLAPAILPTELRAMLSGGLLTFLQFAVTVSLFVTGALVLLALGQLWRTLYRYEFVSTRLTLALAMIVPPVWLAEGFLIGVAETPVARAAIPVPFVALSGAAAWLAINRFGLFDELPAASAVARQDIVAGMSDAAIAITDQRRVVDWNDAAVRLFDKKCETVVGERLTTVLPDTFDVDVLLAGEQTICQLPESDRLVEASAGQITDEDSRVLGYTLTVRDITARRRNARRAEVLNRVLRHNLRNKIDVATAHLRQLTDGGHTDDAGETATTVHEQLVELRELGATAREVESVLQADRCDSEHSVAELVRRAVEAVPEAHATTERRVCDPESASVPVVINTPSAVTSANPEILTPVVRELVSNAVEHGGSTPEPRITVRPDESAEAEQAKNWRIAVVDNGPGIDDHEIKVFEQAEETQLRHGRGLGLWLVWWGIDRLGGEVSFDANNGTTVTLVLPGSLFGYDS
ncbi:MAG: ATP-binding protein [Haloplanus sp.]